MLQFAKGVKPNSKPKEMGIYMHVYTRNMSVYTLYVYTCMDLLVQCTESMDDMIYVGVVRGLQDSGWSCTPGSGSVERSL